jgi:CHASE2 domain-containing sensor protein
VIGLDALFLQRKDSQGDSVLADAFSKTENIVLVSKLDNYDEKSDSYDSLKTSIDILSRYTKNGYANLPDDALGSFRTIRTFMPTALCNGKKELAFPVRIVQMFNKNSFGHFIKRQKEYEMINFRGNFNKFFFIDSEELLDENQSFGYVRNKIVLMGYMGSNISTKSFEDVFFTPLNEKYAGRSFPDMYGIVIHANIVSMLLHGDYIDQLPTVFNILFALLVGFINAIIVLYSKRNFPVWGDSIILTVFFIQTIFNLFTGVFIFSNYNIRINLTLALAVIFLIPKSTDIYNNFLKKLFIRFKHSKRTSHE